MQHFCRLFHNLTGKIEFYVENDWWDNWETAYTTILDALQGKRVELALEDNPAHCYKGLLWVNTWKSQKGNSTITLEYNLQPDRIDRPVKQLVLNRTSVTLEKGMSFSLLVGIVPADTFYRKLQVTTSPRGIVSIGDDGRITALKNGACTIRAELGGTVAECAVRVQNYGLCKVENELANCRNENLDEAVKVYNLEIEDSHTYYVSADEVLVHNECTKNNYRSEYIKENPGMPNEYQVHHTLPQKYSDLFEGTDINIHDVENLRGVPRDIHTMITNMWGNWDRNLDHSPDKDDVIEFAQTIDKLFETFWYKEN